MLCSPQVAFKLISVSTTSINVYYQGANPFTE